MTYEQRLEIQNKYGLTEDSPKLKCEYCIKDSNNNIIRIGPATNMWRRFEDCYNIEYLRNHNQWWYRWMLNNFGNYTVEIYERPRIVTANCNSQSGGFTELERLLNERI